MLDIKLIRDNVEEVITQLSKRNGNFSYLREVVVLDEKRRQDLQKVEELKQFRNEKSKQIGLLKKQGASVDSLMQEVAGIGDEITKLDQGVNHTESLIQQILAATPNIPFLEVPYGKDEHDNVEVKRFMEPPTFAFEPKAHWDLATQLDIIDFERAAKITGARFALYKKAGARLERALANFMLDLHTEMHGYTEVLPPYLVNNRALFGTGQLPKFEEDLFQVNTGYYLIPTAEVPVTNIHQNEILALEQLPIRYTAYTPCFRAEAGAAGRDTRGIIRQHQFNKVELVQFVTPEQARMQLEQLLLHAEKVLQLLELPYQVIKLCGGDMGFASALTYDINVWLPSYQAYKEISSCSCFSDFQARRANIRFKRDPKGKTEFVYTLNGSGLAIGRTVAAILENYQNEDGTIRVPAVLVPYMGGITIIS